ncbi:type VI secretion system baseplate subunit TssF, partial [Enterobacter hormaechei]
AELDFQNSRQLDAVMHHQEFQKVESLWRGLKQLVDSTDYLNADSGRITRFLQTRLNGVLHREGSHWVPDSINAQGLTFKPTLPAYPPAEDRFHWRVMSHLGSRFLNMMSSALVLRGTLSLYNWRDDELNNRRLDAILDVRHHRIQRFEDGFLLRGLDVEVTLDSNGFTGEGDIHLFGELLNRFFALYADMNQFNQLTLIVQPEGKCIRWKENHSPRLPG